MAGDCVFWYVNGYNYSMKTLKTFRNLLLLLWFGWFVLAGIVVTGLMVWLTPISLSGLAIVAWGTLAGVLLGAGVAAAVLVLIWRRIGAPLLSGLATVRFIREQLLQFNSRYRF